MSLPMLNGTARLIEDPQLRYGASGGAVVTVRLAFNSRKKDQSGQWVDDATCFLDGKAFGASAENIVESVSRGMEVVVSGRLKTESWEKDGEKRSKTVLMVDSIGPSLRFATAKVSKAGGSGQGRQQYEETRRQTSQEGREDLWGSGVPGTAPAAGARSDDPPF